MTPSLSTRPSARWTPAQLYLWTWGPLLLVLGIGSLIVHPDFSLGSDVTARHLFGVFDTNGWHGILGLLTGAVALLFVSSERYSTVVAAGIGLGAGLVPAAIFFAVGNGGVALGLIPVDLADGVCLHLVPGVIGLGAAAATWRQQQDQRRRISPTSARRTS